MHKLMPHCQKRLSNFKDFCVNFHLDKKCCFDLRLIFNQKQNNVECWGPLKVGIEQIFHILYEKVKKMTSNSFLGSFLRNQANKMRFGTRNFKFQNIRNMEKCRAENLKI